MSVHSLLLSHSDTKKLLVFFVSVCQTHKGLSKVNEVLAYVELAISKKK